MERQSRLLLALAAVLLGLVAVIALLDPPEEEVEEVAEWERLLPGVEADEVVSVKIVAAGGDGGEALRALTRDPDGWRIVAPLQADADDTRVEAMVDSIVTVEVGADLGGAPADYGLARPRATITLETRGGDTHQLAVGDPAPVGAHTYLRRLPDGPPVASRGPLSAAVAVSLADLREAALWALPTSAVTELEVTGPDRRVRLRREGRDWWVGDGEGPERRAAARTVEAALQALASLRAAGFRDDLAAGDLDPAWRVRVRAAGGEQVLEVQGGDGAWLARGPLQPGVVQLEEGWADPLAGPLPGWWDRTLLPVPRRELAEVRLVLGEASATAVADPEGGFRPGEGLAVVEALEAATIRPEDTAAPEGPAWGSLVLVGTDGATRKLRFHQRLPDGGRVAVDEAGGAPFVLPASEVGRLSSVLAPSGEGAEQR